MKYRKEWKKYKTTAEQFADAKNFFVVRIPLRRAAKVDVIEAGPFAMLQQKEDYILHNFVQDRR